MYAGSCQWLHSTGVTVGYVMAAGMSHILLKGGTCQCMAPCHNVIQVNTNNRGGASEASVATLTGDVDGSSR